MSKTLAIVAMLALLMDACDRVADFEFGKTPVMEVRGKVLYYEDLMDVMPDGLNSADSANFCESYKHRWAVKNLLYDKAADKVGNMKEINAMAEDFRRELIINEYKRQIVANRMEEISEDSIIAYYDRKKQDFPLREAVVKGVFLKVPATSPLQDQLKQWLGDLNDENLDNIMRYCTQNALACDFFNDTWTPYHSVSAKLIENIDSNDPMLTRSTIVQKDGANVCYLRISGLVKAGQPMPVELASKEIRNIMSNKRKMDIIKAFEEQTYREAIENDKIKTFDIN